MEINFLYLRVLKILKSTITFYCDFLPSSRREITLQLSTKGIKLTQINWYWDILKCTLPLSIGIKDLCINLWESEWEDFGIKFYF